MIVWGFDLGLDRTGFGTGQPGTIPRSGALLLRKKGQPRAVALGNFMAFLVGEFNGACPHLVAALAPMRLGAFSRKREDAPQGVSEAAVRASYGQWAVLEAVCARFGVRLEEVHEATMLRHFVGTGRVKPMAGQSGRDAKKAATVARCHQLGYFPREKYDEDRADGCGVWDFACATFCGTPPRELVLFGES